VDFTESLRMAVTTLTANKLRSSLTMLGIVIGNASVIAMVGIGEGAQRYINRPAPDPGSQRAVCRGPGNRQTRELGGLRGAQDLWWWPMPRRSPSKSPTVVGTAPEFSDRGLSDVSKPQRQ
jgi:putative ABC transport system permease protein